MHVWGERLQPTQHKFDVGRVYCPTEDITLLTAFPKNSDDRLPFEAGQYVEALLNDGTCLALSMANAPEPSGVLHFQLRHNEQHPQAKRWLHQTLASKTIQLMGPKGDMTLRHLAPTTSSLVFLAGGTGFAPIRALLAALFTQVASSMFFTTLPRIQLFWGITRPEDAYDRDLLTAWEDQYPFFRYTLVLWDPTLFPTWKGAHGGLPDHCVQHVHEWEKTIVFASGPVDMIHNVFHALTNAGLPPAQFLSDFIKK